MKIVYSIVIILITLLVTTSCLTTKATNDFYGLTLVNNSKAVDINSMELMTFLEQDKTNEHEVVIYHHEDPAVEVNWWCKGGKGIKPETLREFVTSGYMCINFAVDLHNNAEKVGIQCAIVENHKIGHAFNAFNTPDKSIVYVDASSGYDYIIIPAEGYDLTQYCKVREGVADTFLMELGNPKEFEIRW